MAKTTKATTKAATAKKAAKKPTTVTRHVATKKKAKSTAVQPPFFQTKFTEQSLYWIIFGAAAIAFALWLFTIDAKIRDMYDQIDANTSSIDATLYEQKQKATKE